MSKGKRGKGSASGQDSIEQESVSFGGERKEGKTKRPDWSPEKAL